VYQWFEGIALEDRFMLYEGEIASPITWDEGDRTLFFEVITKLADQEVGFSLEEGNFPHAPDDLIGKPWPLCFGHVQNVPALRLVDVPTGQTLTDTGVVDRSILDQLFELSKEWNILKEFYIWYAIGAGYCKFKAEYICITDECYNHWWGLYESTQAAHEQMAQQMTQNEAEQVRLREQYRKQVADASTSIQVSNGEDFPQGVTIQIRTGNVIYISWYYVG
jgi:hypothetical protein